MSSQIYKDLSLIFGPPAGIFFEHIVTASQRTGVPRCELYEEMLFERFDAFEEEDLFNQMFSSVIGEDLTIGENFRTRQTFSRARSDMEKLITNPDERVSVPVLMFFPSKFLTLSGSPIKSIVTTDHLKVVGAIIGQSLKLDWVQSIAAHDSQAA